MKRVIFTLFAVLSFAVVSKAATYYWIGGLNATSFTSGGNWTTDPVTRTPVSGSITIGTSDVFIFDGTNVGPTITPVTTGSIVILAGSLSSSPFAQLKLINAANLTIGRSSSGSSGYVISGDGTADDDLVIDATSTLTLGSATYDYNTQFTLSAGATGKINGTMYLSPISNSVHTRSFITVAAANALVFENGSACHITDSTATGGFNGSVAGAITFKSGSSMYYYSGRSPIGSSSSVQLSNFEPGSNCYFRGSNVSYVDGTTAYSSSSWVNSKTMANLFIQNGATLTADGPVYKIENFTIDNGCTFITHTTGNTPVLGNLTVNGSLVAPTAGTTNVLSIGGSSGPQTISGTGTINVLSFIVGNHSDVTLAKNITVSNICNILGKLDMGTSQISGSSSFTTRVQGSAADATGNPSAGSYLVTGASALSGVVGLKVTCTTPNILSPNTNVVGFGTGLIYLSKPALTSATGVTFQFSSDSATLATSNANGLDTLTGSVVVTGTKSFQSGSNFIFNGATTKPFGISSSAPSSAIAGNITFNAAVTTNYNMKVTGTLTLNTGKLSIQPTDTLRIVSGNAIAGTGFGSSKYIATNKSGANVGVLAMDQVPTGGRTFPVGSAANYLPVTLTPTSIDAFALSAFDGITTDGTANGTAMTAAQKAKVVDAVWTINRISSNTNNCSVALGWPASLEGSSFSAYGNNIGVARYSSGWGTVGGSGNNTTNTATNTFNAFSPFGVGELGFILPVKLSNVSAKEEAGKIRIQWNVETEINVEGYAIEKSVDGRSFSTINAVNAIGSKQYASIDNTPSSNNYYRIKVQNKNGSIEYSNIVNIKLNGRNPEIVVFPNPVKGNIVSLQLSNLDKGRASVQLFNNNGQQLFTTTINYEGGSQLQNIVLPANVSKGTYRLVVTNNNNKLQQTIFVD